METVIENILIEHKKLSEWVIHLSGKKLPEVRDIESIIPKIKELFKKLESVNTKQLPYKTYHQLQKITEEWNSILSYFNIQMMPCKIRPFLWVSPKVAIKRLPRKSIEGIVVSTKMQKTAIIEVVNTQKHPKYSKTIQKTKRYKIHDPLEECRIGDNVLAFETRRFSKTKYHIFYRKIY